MHADMYIGLLASSLGLSVETRRHSDGMARHTTMCSNRLHCAMNLTHSYARQQLLKQPLFHGGAIAEPTRYGSHLDPTDLRPAG
jgi:hypothetical protein